MSASMCVFRMMCASVPVSECVFGCVRGPVRMVGCMYVSVSECTCVFSKTKDECVFSDVYVCTIA